MSACCQCRGIVQKRIRPFPPVHTAQASECRSSPLEPRSGPRSGLLPRKREAQGRGCGAFSAHESFEVSVKYRYGLSEGRRSVANS